MDVLKAIFTNWFFLGFLLGFSFCILSLIAQYKTRKELKRLKGHLSDKLELEAEKLTGMKGEISSLKKENDNLRLKINAGKLQLDSQAMEHELEIFARAEKAMVMAAPGFAQAWEKAKESALSEVEKEEQGRSLPRRIFKRFFNRSGGSVDAEPIQTLPSESALSDQKEAASTTTAED